MSEKYRVKISVHRVSARKGEKVRPGFDLDKQVNADSFREAYDRVAKAAETIIGGLDNNLIND